MEIKDTDMIEDEKIILTIDDKEISCDVLFKYEDDDLDYDYVAFTDGSKDAQGREIVMFARTSIFNGFKYELVSDPKELELMNAIMESMTK